MKLPPLSLRGKLFAFAAALIVIPGVLLGLLADRSARDSLQTLIGRELAREAVHAADRLSILLRSERDTLWSFARQDLMREIRVADIDKRVSRALATLRDGSPTRLGYFVLDAGGRAVAASSAHWIGDTVPLQADIASVVNGDAGLAGPIDAEPGQALAIATPIPDPDGGTQTLGTLVGLLDWKNLMSLLEEVRRDLASQDILASLRLVDAQGGSIAFSGESGESGEAFSGEAEVPVVTGSSKSGFAVDTTHQVIAGWASLDADAPPWRLLVVEPLDHALAPARALTRRLALTMAVALAAALALATLSARRVVSPLSELTDAIRRMARSGIGGTAVPVRSRDEVGVLARSFNQMASDLEHAQQNLVEAEKFAFVGELASGVAHEVRTSLGVLRSSAQMLDRSLAVSPDSKVPELVGMIRDEVDRLGRVVDDLLTLDRRRALHPEPTPLSLPVLRAAEFVEPQAKEKGVEIRVEQAEVDPIISCDREALQHVCVNLLVNAVQSLDPGGRIELVLSAPKNGFASLRVSDDGPGIPDELRDRIFDPFMTGRETGVGLGLTFVKRAVHEHEGRITVEASPEGGACFHLELPLADRESTRAEDPA